MEDSWLIPYEKESLIIENISNNAFSFASRKARLQQEPTLSIPALKNINYADLLDNNFEQISESKKTAFEDFDEYDQLKTCKGLAYFIHTLLPNTLPDNTFTGETGQGFTRHNSKGTPVYIFDNHNHAFYFWLKHLNEQKHKKCASKYNAGRPTLVHVDQHKDSRIPSSIPHNIEAILSPALAFKYTNEILNVGNFVGAADKLKLFEDIITVDSEEALRSILSTEQKYFFLDLDLDFFSPEMDYINNDLKIDIILNLMKKASLITIATSPFFIEFSLAKKFLIKLLPKSINFG